jgi:hypothetical protein
MISLIYSAGNLVGIELHMLDAFDELTIVHNSDRITTQRLILNE